MRVFGGVVVCLSMVIVAGCAEDMTESAENRDMDKALVQTLTNIGVENAVIAEHTLYPHHFVLDSDRLNELGERDLAILARHFSEQPGTLNIRRDRTPPSLYEARIAHVIGSLRDSGIEPERLSISDGMPGGSGMASERLLTVLEEGLDLSTASTSGSGTSMSR
jgi:hypothetical protein